MWQATDEGERTKDGLDCETEKKRGIRSEANGETEYRETEIGRDMRNVLK